MSPASGPASPANNGGCQRTLKTSVTTSIASERVDGNRRSKFVISRSPVQVWLSAPQVLSVQTRRAGEEPAAVVTPRSSQGPATREKTAALITAAVRDRVRTPKRGFVVLDFVVWTQLSAIALAVVCLVAFNLVKDEQAADATIAEARAETALAHARLGRVEDDYEIALLIGEMCVAAANRCLDGWERTTADLNAAREHCASRGEYPAEAFGFVWAPEKP